MTSFYDLVSRNEELFIQFDLLLKSRPENSEDSNDDFEMVTISALSDGSFILFTNSHKMLRSNATQKNQSLYLGSIEQRSSGL
jgi:hypothetical protein